MFRSNGTRQKWNTANLDLNACVVFAVQLVDAGWWKQLEFTGSSFESPSKLAFTDLNEVQTRTK